MVNSSTFDYQGFDRDLANLIRNSIADNTKAFRSMRTVRNTVKYLNSRIDDNLYIKLSCQLNTAIDPRAKRKITTKFTSFKLAYISFDENTGEPTMKYINEHLI